MKPVLKAMLKVEIQKPMRGQLRVPSAFAGSMCDRSVQARITLAGRLTGQGYETRP